MGQRLDARDVLDANARTRRAFSGTVVGYFRPTGANPWDEYEYTSVQEASLEVLPGLEVQMEPRGAQFRLRTGGRVMRVKWAPRPEELHRLAGDSPAALRHHFTTEYLVDFQEERGRDTPAVIARKLGR